MIFTEILLRDGKIGRGKLEKLVNQSSQDGISLEKLLQAEGIADQEILNAKSEVSGLEIRKFSSKARVPFDALKMIPEEAARHYRFIPLGIKEGFLEVGIIDPSDIEAQSALQFIFSKINFPYRTFLINENDFEAILDSYKGIGSEVSKALDDLGDELSNDKSDLKLDELITTENKIVEDAPVTKIVAVILRHALEGNASDIHIEPVKDQVKVRFRVDGVLYTSIVLPLNVAEAISSRIKIVSNMKIDEKRKPQDGRFDARIEGREVDFRVSTFPSFYGEKVVIRILDKEKGVMGLSQLGVSDHHIKLIREAISRPYGLILLTGPTGSGKTTTLYAMLQELDREKSNVVSLEDPIEYNIDGISQSQIRPEIGYDFANGLRSILRQDPDMIMVGEIRDKETAALAIQAALTGHLVFSTLHTNNASGVVPRLVDMGVDPFLIAPTLILTIGQRLVKALCHDSKKEVILTTALKEIIQKEMGGMPEQTRQSLLVPDKIFEGRISSLCPRGTSGRLGIFEVLQRTPGLESLILTKPSEQDIMVEARKQGMLTMREDGLVKMLGGKISFEEFMTL